MAASNYRTMPRLECRLHVDERSNAARTIDLEFLYEAAKPRGLEWEDIPGLAQHLADILDEEQMRTITRAQKFKGKERTDSWLEEKTLPAKSDNCRNQKGRA